MFGWPVLVASTHATSKTAEFREIASLVTPLHSISKTLMGCADDYSNSIRNTFKVKLRENQKS
jgi:hypothetical protein